MRTVYIQNALNSGELSPLLNARDDFDRYQSGVAKMRNWVPLPYGGARTRFGLQWVAQTKDNGVAYLIPFEVSTLQAYIVEAGDFYFRFYADGGRIFDLTSNITNVVVNGAACQVESGAPHGLSNGNYVSVSGVLGVPGANGEFTVAVVDANNFTLVGSVFSGAYVSGGNWYRPYEIVSPYSIADVRAVKFAQSADTLYLAHQSYQPRKLTRTGITTFAVNTISFIDGPYMDKNTTATTITPSATSGAITLTASASLFNANHVGSLWRLQHSSTWGYAQVTSYTSPTVVNATVINTFGAATATANWREGSWSTFRGFPAAVTIFEQRLSWGSSPSEPQTTWLSTVSSYEDMTPSSTAGVVAASDAVTYKLGSNKVNTIQWMLGSKQLFLGTVGEEVVLKGASDAAVSATNPPVVSSGSSDGSAAIQAIKISSTTVFVQRSGREVRGLQFNFDLDDFQTQELSIIAEHFLRNNSILQMSWQPRPDHTLWMVRDDGALLSLTYYPIEKVQGWALHNTSGSFLSVATVPSTDLTSNQSWYVVERLVGGATKRFVEVQNATVAVDACLLYTGAAVTSVAGLGHLEGRTVKIIGNGAVYDDQVVTGGSVSLKYGDALGPAATSIIVGLAQTPNPLITSLRPAYKDNNGSVRNRFKHWASVEVALFETVGLTINTDTQIQYRKPGDPMDTAVPVFTGDKKVANLGWSKDGTITIEQTQPLPAVVLGYFGDLNVGD